MTTRSERIEAAARASLKHIDCIFDFDKTACAGWQDLEAALALPPDPEPKRPLPVKSKPQPLCGCGQPCSHKDTAREELADRLEEKERAPHLKNEYDTRYLLREAAAELRKKEGP